METQDSVAFVTGADRGLGLVFVRELLRRGAKKVYAGERTPVVSNLPSVVPVKVDVTDPATVSAAAAHCGDVTLLINNAGIVCGNGSALDRCNRKRSGDFRNQLLRPGSSKPGIRASPFGEWWRGIINVLSDATWFPRLMLTAYSASKSAAWSFTNALRIELSEKDTQVLALHVGYMDTDFTKALDVKKSDPGKVVVLTLDALESGGEEVIADEHTVAVKRKPLIRPSVLSEPAG